MSDRSNKNPGGDSTESNGPGDSSTAQKVRQIIHEGVLKFTQSSEYQQMIEHIMEEAEALYRSENSTDQQKESENTKNKATGPQQAKSDETTDPGSQEIERVAEDVSKLQLS